jgi:hypothetical protein
VFFFFYFLVFFFFFFFFEEANETGMKLCWVNRPRVKLRGQGSFRPKLWGAL